MPPTLLPDPSRLRLDYLSASDDVITMVVTTTAAEAHCPLCQQPSTRTHSRYVRIAADLPWNGVAVRLRLTSRRFFCPNEDCERTIFTERLPGIVAPYARRTFRLTDAFELIGFALGGEAGARVLVALSMGASPDTVLRMIRRAILPERETPRVLRVDDFAFRKGQRYGTILVDLERRCRVDVLPDRTAETLRHWLAEHPGVEVISRDRAGAYADGARQGAPQAEQVADRFHLLRNLGEALERVALRDRAALQEDEGAEEKAAVGHPEPDGSARTPAEQEQDERRAKRLERYQAVMALRAQGMGIQTIARELGMARGTVYTFVRADGFPERAPRARRPGVLAPYEAYLRERLAAGCQNGQELWRELREQGYTGSTKPLYRWLALHRTEPAKRGRPRRSKPPIRRKEHGCSSVRTPTWTRRTGPGGNGSVNAPPPWPRLTVWRRSSDGWCGSGMAVPWIAGSRLSPQASLRPSRALPGAWSRIGPRWRRR